MFLAPNENGVKELLILVPKSVVSKRFLVNPSRYISVIFPTLAVDGKVPKRTNSSKNLRKITRIRDSSKLSKDKDKSYILDMTLSPEYYEAYYDNSSRFSDNKSLIIEVDRNSN